MIYLELFWSFVKIGFTSFGGLSMIPLIREEMLAHGWMTLNEVSDIVAIAEMTPGPLGMNCATFAGIRTAGFLGAVVANLGTMSPALTLTAVAAVFFVKFRDCRFLVWAMSGVRPACVGMIAGVLVSLSMTNYVSFTGISVPALFIGLADLFLLFRCRSGIPLVILLSAAAGLLSFGILGSI